MNSQDRNVIYDINQLPAVTHAYWECIHALTNTYEFQKKSAYEQSIWHKKNEEQKKENLIAAFLADIKEKEKRELLEEEIERHYNELKKIFENSFENSTKALLVNQNWKDIQHISELLTIIKTCEAQMMILWKKIIELDEKCNELSLKIEECNQRIKIAQDDIANIDTRIKKRDEEYDRIVHRAFLDKNIITRFDLSKLQSDDVHFMEIILRGIEIIDFNHNSIVEGLKNNLSKEKPSDEETIEKMVNELVKQAMLDLISIYYRSNGLITEEEKDHLMMVLITCDYYKTEVAKITEKFMIEINQEILILPEIKVYRTENKIDYARRADKITVVQESVVEKDKHKINLEEVNSEREKIKDEFQEQAQKREAALNRIKQLKAKKLLNQQAVSEETKVTPLSSMQKHSDGEIKESSLKTMTTNNSAYIKRKTGEEKSSSELSENSNKKANNDAVYQLEHQSKTLR